MQFSGDSPFLAGRTAAVSEATTQNVRLGYRSDRLLLADSGRWRPRAVTPWHD